MRSAEIDIGTARNLGGEAAQVPFNNG